MRKVAFSLIAAAGLTLTAAAAQAQSVGVEIGVGPSYGYTTYGGYGPRYEGYYGYRTMAPVRRSYGPSYGYRAQAPVVIERRAHAGGCGTYYYWNGDHCVDARNK